MNDKLLLANIYKIILQIVKTPEQRFVSTGVTLCSKASIQAHCTCADIRGRISKCLNFQPWKWVGTLRPHQLNLFSHTAPCNCMELFPPHAERNVAKL